MTATEIILILSDDEGGEEGANEIIILSDSEEEDSSEDSSEDTQLGKRSRSSSYVGSVYANLLERRYEDELNGRNDEEDEWWTGTVEDGYPGDDNFK